MSFKNTIFTSVSWSVAGNALSSLSMLVISIIMLRLLQPSDYGVIALANIFISFGVRFSRMGIGPALIQRENIDSDDIRASLTLSIFLGCFFALMLFFVAPYGGIFFKNDTVVAVIRVLSISLIIQGFLITSKSLLERDFQYKKIASVEVISRFIGRGVISISLAFMGFGLWSIVIGVLSVQLLQVFIFYLYTKHSVKPIFNYNVYKRTVNVALKFSLNQFSDFIYANINTLLVGRLFGDVLTGLYERSWTLAKMPIALLLESLNKVMFPVFSRLRNDPVKTKRLFFYNFTLIGLLCVTLAIFFLTASENIVHVLLTEKWSNAIIPIKIMACFTCFEYTTSLFMPLLDGQGKMMSRFWYKQISLAIKFACCAIGYFFYGFHGFLAFLVISEFIYFLIYLTLVAKCLELETVRVLKALIFFIMQGGFTFLLITIVARGASVIFSGRWFLLLSQGTAFLVALLCGVILAFAFKLIEVSKSDLSKIPFLRSIFASHAGVNNENT